MKNKLGFIFITFAILLYSYKKYNDYNDIKFHNEIINSIKDNKNIYNESYIEIPKYNIKRIIKYDIRLLDKNYVIKLNSKNNLIVLAGHNINLVFHKIHYLKKDDIVYLYIDKIHKYKVVSKKEIDINKYNYLNKEYQKNTLILITCTKNNNKRLLVSLEEIT